MDKVKPHTSSSKSGKRKRVEEDSQLTKQLARTGQPDKFPARKEPKLGKSAKSSSSSSSSAAPAAALDDNFDLDAMFGGIAAKKQSVKLARVEAESKQRKSEQLAVAQTEAIRNLEAAGTKANRLKGPDSPVPLRFDASLGLPIYSEAQLKLNAKGGDTPLCPIDCNCCF